jgi:hypothetical protein
VHGVNARAINVMEMEAHEFPARNAAALDRNT